MRKINWKNIIVIWISLGISIAGYLTIFPQMETAYNGLGEFKTYVIRDSTLLITIVGAILIIGLKLIKEKN